MKNINILLLTLLLAVGCSSSAKQTADDIEYNLKGDSIRCRDPFILVDREEGAYYFAAGTGNGFKAYKSRDLENWADLGKVFIPDSSFWGKQDFWAPDMYKYKGKYYIFGTFTGTTEKRGVGILIADRAEGPYRPLVNNPITPREWMSLDGALYIDENDTPWMLYCRDWLDGVVGAIYAQQMAGDLTKFVDDPVFLFTADSAPWSGPDDAGDYRNYVTDSPWIIDLPDGRKTMIWSSHTSAPKHYAIGQLYSENGSMFGPWVHDPEPLNTDDGGHAMTFRDLNGNLKISYHSPNSRSFLTIRDIVIDDKGKITILPKKK